jgi:Pyridine nucleotide-disulphide oxidoreductase
VAGQLLPQGYRAAAAGCGWGLGFVRAFGCFGFIGGLAGRASWIGRAGWAGRNRTASRAPAAATELEARACGPDPVAVVGGANSAAQAALYLAGHGNAVTLIVRGNDLAAGMSSYLADRILAHARITVRAAAEVTALRRQPS